MRYLYHLCLILVVLSFSVHASDTTAKRWDTYFKRKLYDPPAGFVSESLKFIPGNGHGKVAYDLGSGIGHESMLLLKRGFQVIAVDYQASSFDYMELQNGFERYKSNLTPVITTFEKLNFTTLPAADIVVASFSLPFLDKKDFNQVWRNVVNNIKPGGYFIGNFFHPEFTFFDKKFHPHMTFHTKEQALGLFSQFEVIFFKEVQVASLKPGTIEHYFVIFAKKNS